MSEILPFLVVGLVSGSVYGLAGVGLTLSYRTSGLVNFAHGSVAAAGAYLTYFLYVERGWPWPTAVGFAVVAVGGVGGLLLAQVAERFSTSVGAAPVLGTVGVTLVIQGVLERWKGTEYIPFPQYLPAGGFRLLGANVRYDQALIFGIGLTITILLYLILRLTRFGYAMRAVVDDPELVGLIGTNPSAIRRWAWTLSCMTASLSGALLAPSLSLNSTALTLLVIQAFGAAALGSFSSLPKSYLGGLIVGVTAAIATKYLHGYAWLSGVPSAIPFIVLLLVLVVGKRAALTPPSSRSVRLQTRWRAPSNAQLTAAVGLFLGLALVPQVVGYRLPVYTVALAYCILFMSLGLLARMSGQVSLCHVGFAAIGAASMAHFVTDWHVPWLVALLLAGLAVVPVGMLVAIPASRVSGVFLALATLGLGVVLERVFYGRDLMFGEGGRAAVIPRPAVGGLAADDRYYYVVLAAAVAVAFIVEAMSRARLGRFLKGMSDSPTVLEVSGASTILLRMVVFAISAFIAGVAGALIGATIHTANGSSFPAYESLTLFVLMALVPGRLPWCAVGAALAYKIMPSYLREALSASDFTILFGLSAVVTAFRGLLEMPEGVTRRLDLFFGRRVSQPSEAAVSDPRKDEPFRARAVSQAQDDGLCVSGLSIRYGGIAAVSDLSFSAPYGEITGLIGPNGAGKSSTLNACSGFVRPDSGVVALNGVGLSRMTPHARARRGLGRTFQRVELFESLTVEENVALVCEAARANDTALSHLVAPRGARDATRSRTADALDLCDVASLSHVRVSTLPTGHRRLVELARCLAGGYQMLLLDEPSSGLDGEETERLGEVLRTAVRERGIGVVLVEHDMTLVMGSCDRIYVLDFGALIFAGTSRELSLSMEVRTAYLGDGHGAAGVSDAPAAASR